MYISIYIAPTSRNSPTLIPANIEKIFIQNLFLRKLTSCHIFMTVPLKQSFSFMLVSFFFLAKFNSCKKLKQYFQTFLEKID